MDLSVCYVGVTPSILTVSTGVGGGSTTNIQRGFVPNNKVSVYLNRLAPLVGTSQVPKYECLDSNQVKAANLAERVYKTPLTTKSHSHKGCLEATYKSHILP
jgi:hypothetical protein